MSLGTAIFLSAVLLSIVILYVNTRSSWAWGKLVKRTLLAGLVFLLLIGGAVGTYLYLKERPQKQEELFGIRLESLPGDIKFLKGEPSSVEEDGDLWVYLDSFDKKLDYYVRFQAGKVRFVAMAGNLDSVQGIYVDMSRTEEVYKKFGTPSDSAISADETMRIYCYSQFQLCFRVVQNKVQTIFLYNPSLGGPIRFSPVNAKLPSVKPISTKN